MKIQLLFFAQARERAGCAQASLELPDESRVGDALERIRLAYPDLAGLMPHLAVAVNQKLARPADPIPAGAELALLPPVSGGLAAAPTKPARPTVKPPTTARSKPAFEVRPATAERWNDLERLFGPRGACAGCWCQWPRVRGKAFDEGRGAGNRARLRRQVSEGREPGLIGDRAGEPVAWCALAPRTEDDRIENSRTLARVDGQEVWSIPCFFVAREQRGRGLTVRMLRAAADHARARGVTLLEGYPVDSRGRSADAFVWWGLVPAFRKAGFTEVGRRSATHPVWRRRLRGRAPLVRPGPDTASNGTPARQPRKRKPSRG